MSSMGGEATVEVHPVAELCGFSAAKWRSTACRAKNSVTAMGPACSGFSTRGRCRLTWSCVSSDLTVSVITGEHRRQLAQSRPAGRDKGELCYETL